VRWFPDGAPGRKPSRHPTDVEWLACALAYLDADVVALEEIKSYPRARQQLDELVRRLTELSPGDYRVRLDDCEAETSQHVGLFWNEKRVRAQDFRTISELNPHGSACENQLRPGLGARLRFPGGLDLLAVAVHLKSGGERRALELRQRSVERLPAVFADVVREFEDDDLLLLGDFNTMGCSHCSPRLDADGELKDLGARLARMQRPLQVLPSEPGCSHYFGGKAGLLDLVVAPRAMRELGAGARVVSSGVCAALGCGPAPSPPPAAHRDLSDHCPIVVDLVDRDLD
jgi:endonuclease/exonuclease/phosphatase family metal-dependent hydrolase